MKNKDINTNSNKLVIWLKERGRSYLLLIICGLIIAVTTIALFKYTQGLLRNRLEERLNAITATASAMFDVDDVNELIRMGEQGIGTQKYRSVVTALREIKDRNKDIRYAYIFYKKDDGGVVRFLADADTIALQQQFSYTGDESDEGDWVGSEYDVSEVPAILSGDAFNFPTTDLELIEDEWGITFSGYAPIRKHLDSEASALIGIDVDITEYMHIISSTFIPFVAFIYVLLFLIFALTLSVIQMWDSRVHLLKELDRQKDELLSIVSHQLATPISAVKWNLEMMIDGDMGKMTKDQEEHLKTIQPQTENLADLASMILDVSRIQLGRMKVDRTELDVAEFAQDVFNEVQPKAEEKGVKYSISVAKDVPKMMLDKRLSRMTMENLLTNAVKYTPKGGTV
ncbi:HAMP domain-containing histidine kinase, partial [Patescibacteria group bacterium]|nr:HAMP domain-containing histidine kinase [Patescibacteria group bacterium]